MKPLLYMIAGAMIPVCIYQMAKSKSFTNVIKKVEQACTNMETMANQGSSQNQNS